MNPFHKWLISQRKWCEHDGCRMKLEPAARVVNRNGKDFVYCEFHGRGPIEAGLRKRYQLMIEGK